MNSTLDLSLLKASASKDASLRLAIPLADGTVIGTLLLAGAWVLDDRGLLDQVTQWRRRSARMFLSQFEPTIERTQAYFREIALAKSDRALFFLVDPENRVMGHMGIANWTTTSAELDNVVRGIGGGHPQLMYFAERRLLDWVFAQSSVSRIFARVLSYNWMAQDLHSSLGFVTTQRQSLKKVVTAEAINHEPVSPESANVAYQCVIMEIAAPL